MSECGVVIDTNRLFREAGVIYFGQPPTCTRDPGHQGSHRDGEAQWTQEWSR